MIKLKDLVGDVTGYDGDATVSEDDAISSTTSSCAAACSWSRLAWWSRRMCVSTRGSSRHRDVHPAFRLACQP